MGTRVYSETRPTFQMSHTLAWDYITKNTTGEPDQDLTLRAFGGLVFHFFVLLDTFEQEFLNQTNR